MKTILVPVDFSRTTKSVVTFAAELASCAGARMTLLNVTRPEVLLKEHTKLEELVERVFARRDPPGQVSGDSLEMIGKPPAVILDQARRLAADYIVMGAHRPTNLAGKGIGRTARDVIRDAECPVILVPAPKPRRRTTARKTRHEALAYAGRA
jgi:universal stress protein A